MYSHHQNAFTQKHHITEVINELGHWLVRSGQVILIWNSTASLISFSVISAQMIMIVNTQ